MVSAHVASDPRVSICSFLFCCYEMMSNCSQHYWINWNSAIGVWTFDRCLRPLYSHHNLCMENLVWFQPCIHVYHVFHPNKITSAATPSTILTAAAAVIATVVEAWLIAARGATAERCTTSNLCSDSRVVRMRVRIHDRGTFVLAQDTLL